MDTVTMWAIFGLLTLGLLVFDLGLLHRKPREIGTWESLMMTAFYMAIALAFGGWIWWERGLDTALSYYTGYVTEFSLSLDNIFVIALILGIFHIPRTHQHRVLLFGVLGVVLMRGILIACGAVLIEQYHWTLYLMAAFLMYTGLHMIVSSAKTNPLKAGNPIVNFCRRHLRVTDELHGQKFFVRLTDKTTGHKATYMTPLMMALIMIEAVDVLFALDSVPAIFAITTDPYIVFTSNMFAILGLRSLYFALSAVLQRFAYMKYALALLLVFIGGKVLVVEAWLHIDFPSWLSLLVTAVILSGGIFYSMWKTRRKAVRA